MSEEGRDLKILTIEVYLPGASFHLFLSCSILFKSLGFFCMVVPSIFCCKNWHMNDKYHAFAGFCYILSLYIAQIFFLIIVHHSFIKIFYSSFLKLQSFFFSGPGLVIISGWLERPMGLLKSMSLLVSFQSFCW